MCSEFGNVYFHNSVVLHRDLCQLLLSGVSKNLHNSDIVRWMGEGVAYLAGVVQSERGLVESRQRKEQDCGYIPPAVRVSSIQSTCIVHQQTKEFFTSICHQLCQSFTGQIHIHLSLEHYNVYCNLSMSPDSIFQFYVNVNDKFGYCFNAFQ